MLEYKVINFPSWFFSTIQKRYKQEDTRSWQSQMKTITLILPLEVTTMNNPSNRRIDSGVKVGVKVKQQQENW